MSTPPPPPPPPTHTQALQTTNSNVKFFCTISNLKVEIAFQFFDNMQNKQELVASKVKIIEETTVTDNK